MSISVSIGKFRTYTFQERQEILSGKDYAISKERRKELMDLSSNAGVVVPVGKVCQLSNASWDSLIKRSELSDILQTQDGMGGYSGDWNVFRKRLTEGATCLKQRAVRAQSFQRRTEKTVIPKGPTIIQFFPSLEDDLEILRNLWRASKAIENGVGEELYWF